MSRPILLLALVPAALALTGCVERRIEITSEPSGAMVWLNDQQVGRTPTQASFLFHGVYDVRLELDGYEPMRTTGEAEAPIYEHAPLDLIAEAVPVRFKNVQHWHFVLEPTLESTLGREELEAGLLGRAGAMRDELAAIPAPGQLAEAPAERASAEGDEADEEPLPRDGADG